MSNTSVFSVVSSQVGRAQYDWISLSSLHMIVAGKTNNFNNIWERLQTREKSIHFQFGESTVHYNNVLRDKLAEISRFWLSHLTATAHSESCNFSHKMSCTSLAILSDKANI